MFSTVLKVLTRAGYALLLVLVFAAVSCTSDSSSGDGLSEAERAFMSAALPSPKELQLEEDRKYRDSQEIIGECMASLGFDYYVGSPETQPRIDVGQVRVPAERAAEFGYAIFVQYEGSSVYELGDQMEPDPNWELLGSMEDAEADAWLAALDGSSSKEGCRSKGDIAYLAQSPADRINAYFADEYSSLVDAVLADSRILEAEQQWSRCMAEAGFFFEFAAHAIGEFESQMAPDLTEEELGRLQQSERAQAAADANCPNNNFGEMSALYDEVYQEVYLDFVAANEGPILVAVGLAGAESEAASGSVPDQDAPPGNSYLGLGSSKLQAGGLNKTTIEISEDVASFVVTQTSPGVSVEIEENLCTEGVGSCYIASIKVDDDAPKGEASIIFEAVTDLGARSETWAFLVF